MPLESFHTAIPFRDSSVKDFSDLSEISFEVHIRNGEKVVLMDMNPTSLCGDRTLWFRADDILALNELILAFRG